MYVHAVYSLVPKHVEHNFCYFNRQIYVYNYPISSYYANIPSK